jgi:hypothetical protein
MKKECEAHYKEGNYRLVKRSELPGGATFLSSVWQIKRKRKLSTLEISKYTARMNVDGSQMIKGRGNLCTSSTMGNHQTLHIICHIEQLAYQTIRLCISIHTG